MIDFDRWREEYDGMTLEDHRHFWNRLEEEYPEQSYTNSSAVRRSIGCHGVSEVAELGGWKGDLASAILSDDEDITSWVNYDILEKAFTDRSCHDSRYSVVLIDSLPWELSSVDADFIVLGHVLEHMKLNHVRETLNGFCAIASGIYVDMPLVQSPLNHDWTGVTASHIFEHGWDQFVVMALETGFDLEFSGHENEAFWGYFTR